MYMAQKHHAPHQECHQCGPFHCNFRFCRGLLMLGSTIALIAVVTPFALPPLIPILLLFYFIYLYFQVR